MFPPNGLLCNAKLRYLAGEPVTFGADAGAGAAGAEGARALVRRGPERREGFSLFSKVDHLSRPSKSGGACAASSCVPEKRSGPAPQRAGRRVRLEHARARGSEPEEGRPDAVG